MFGGVARCQFCGLWFVDKLGLVAHLNAAHRKQQDKWQRVIAR